MTVDGIGFGGNATGVITLGQTGGMEMPMKKMVTPVDLLSLEPTIDWTPKAEPADRRTQRRGGNISGRLRCGKLGRIPTSADGDSWRVPKSSILTPCAERRFGMTRAISLRMDYDGSTLRRLAKKARDAAQVRRLLALASIYDGEVQAVCIRDRRRDGTDRS